MTAELKVNDAEVPLNDLMEAMLENIILGYLKTTKGLPEAMKEIEIKIKL